MTTPMWMLLGFATWTLLLLMATVGVYRWVRILFSHVPIASFRSDQLEGEDWYRRGTRAHANCVENLPVFGAIVWVISALGIDGSVVNALSILVLTARVCQSLVHVSHVQTDAFVAVRFSFFCVQLVCFLALIAIAAWYGVIAK
ncbi:putative MAPEG superfamily protein [Pseudomonas sp. JAI111]|uniref:MAPEG family protein n=1 Tax=Pseudomonas sp. JAI111 TaxID=2735913 RepID=UPI0021696B2E|nr:MAPEG family protein [Pseudomonas sp. JAI111]MCS3838894.1 putative MAPEG superfamily protein [Pseudomonas sp. JAI111]